MKSSNSTFIRAHTGTPKNIPIGPKYAPPKVTAKITKIGLKFNDVPKILGLIILASICWNDTTTSATQSAFTSPPVNTVIIIVQLLQGNGIYNIYVK